MGILYQVIIVVFVLGVWVGVIVALEKSNMRHEARVASRQAARTETADRDSPHGSR